RNANKMGDFINSRLKWRINSFYISKVSYVASVSEECRKDFLTIFNFPETKIRTIEIGVEKKEFTGLPEDLSHIFSMGPVITNIGSFVPEKNHMGLLRIFHGLRRKIPKAQLLLIGKGPLEFQMKEAVSKLGMDQSVHFLGYRKDVLEILHNSEVFVLPSLIEGLPAVILEAMYCETPVIAYNVGGIGEVVIANKTGWLVKKNDEADF